MALFTGTQQQYYTGLKSFEGDGTTTDFIISRTENAIINQEDIKVYIDNDLFAETYYNTGGTLITNYTLKTTATATPWAVTDYWYIEFDTAPANGVAIVVNVDTNYGNYQFASLKDVINNFMMNLCCYSKRTIQNIIIILLLNYTLEKTMLKLH